MLYMLLEDRKAKVKALRGLVSVEAATRSSSLRKTIVERLAREGRVYIQ